MHRVNERNREEMDEVLNRYRGRVWGGVHLANERNREEMYEVSNRYRAGEILE